jgi:hypothetical protein
MRRDRPLEVRDMPSANDMNIPLNEGLAYIVGFAGVVLPSLVFWQYGGEELIGAFALVKLLGFTGVAGALTLALYAGSKAWRLALLPGVVAGVGASGLLVAYSTALARTSMSTGEIGIVCVAGAVPGILLFKLLSIERAAP